MQLWSARARNRGMWWPLVDQFIEDLGKWLEGLGPRNRLALSITLFLLWCTGLLVVGYIKDNVPLSLFAIGVSTLIYIPLLFFPSFKE